MEKRTKKLKTAVDILTKAEKDGGNIVWVEFVNMFVDQACGIYLDLLDRGFLVKSKKHYLQNHLTEKGYKAVELKTVDENAFKQIEIEIPDEDSTNGSSPEEIRTDEVEVISVEPTKEIPDPVDSGAAEEVLEVESEDGTIPVEACGYCQGTKNLSFKEWLEQTESFGGDRKQWDIISGGEDLVDHLPCGKCKEK